MPSMIALRRGSVATLLSAAYLGGVGNAASTGQPALDASAWLSGSPAGDALLPPASDVGDAPPQPNAALLETDHFGEQYVARELLVQVKPGLPTEEAEELLRGSGFAILNHFTMLGDVYHVRLTTGEGTVAALWRLLDDPNVRDVNLNYVRRFDDHATRPNDTLFPLQWHLHNDGKPAQSVPGQLHSDQGPTAFFFDGDAGAGGFRGESIYNDLDGDGKVSAADGAPIYAAGDAGVPANGTALMAFHPRERYRDGNGNLRLDAGECVYRDVNNDRLVSVDDLRLVPCGGNPVATVAAGDADIGDAIREFFGAGVPGEGPGVIDADIDALQAWEHGRDCRGVVMGVIDSGIDFTHPDINDNAWVNPAETAGNGIDDDGNGVIDDVNGASFTGRERHREDINANFLYDFNVVAGRGEYIYVDNDGDGFVSIGDIRLHGNVPDGAAGSYAVDSVVAAGDADLVNPAHRLVDFLSLPARFEKHDHITFNGVFDSDEAAYNDVDNSGTVTANDVRLTRFTDGLNNYNAGTTVAGGNADIGRNLFAFHRGTTRHVERGPQNGILNANEEIYLDCDASSSISVGDFRLTRVPLAGPLDYAALTYVAAGNTDLGAGLFPFNALERFVDGDNSGFYEPNIGEVIIGDLNADGLVTNTGVAADDDVVIRGGGGLPANGTALTPFTTRQMHSDPNLNGFFDAGEWAYRDVNDDGSVSIATAFAGFAATPGDVRVMPTFAGLAADTRVAAGHADVAIGLRRYYVSDASVQSRAQYHRHVDPNLNRRYESGELIYNDVDNSMTVTQGDRRLVPVPNGVGGDYAIDSVVGAADADIQNPRTPLREFAVNYPSGVVADLDGHGTAVAGMIGAEGNNARDVTGVCWQAHIMALRSNLTDASILSCLDYVVHSVLIQLVDVKIVNMSFGGKFYSRMTHDAIVVANLSPLFAEAVLFTASSGNDADDNDPLGGAADWVYLDNNNNGIVDVGDSRISGSWLPLTGIAAGGNVAAGDADASPPLPQPLPLRPFLALERHVDDPGRNNNFYDGPNVIFDTTEAAYYDIDASATVTVGDLRLASFTDAGVQYGRDFVKAGDPDLAGALVAFRADEKYVDRARRGVINGVFDGNAPNFPASYSATNLVSVGATNNRDNLAAFSNFGDHSVHVNAPGQAVLTLRRTADGGGTQYIDGTSFASPLVAGIAGHIWTRPGHSGLSLGAIKAALLSEHTLTNDATALPHGVERRWGSRNSVISGRNDGRARMSSGGEYGDTGFATKRTVNGARHEDCWEEWLARGADIPAAVLDALNPAPIGIPVGGGASPEFDALDHASFPPDPDGIGNTGMAGPAIVLDQDARDDGIEFIGPLRFSSPMVQRPGKVRVWIRTMHGNAADGAGGRYFLPFGEGDGVHGPNDESYLWVNGFFDWNRNDYFGDPGEHVFMLRADPYTWGAAKSAVYEITFTMPNAPIGVAGPTTVPARFRLDYGENCGQSLDAANLTQVVGPSPGGRLRLNNAAGTDLPIYAGIPAGPRSNLFESTRSGIIVPPGTPVLDAFSGLAQFGEVEDRYRSIEPAVYQPEQRRRYVKPTATGANNGTSWTDAFVSLQDALQVAATSSGDVDELWCAQGEYYPASAGDDRIWSFQLVDGVALYGGFPGNPGEEDNFAVRNPDAYISLLSGDLNGDDSVGFANNDENSYHVVTADGVGSTAILDGFTISGGNADDLSPDDVGGGIRALSGSPTIRGCTFDGNSAFYGGGGLYCATNAMPTIVDCTFSGNQSTGGGACGNCGGGAIYCEYDSPARIVNCRIDGNTAVNAGGGIFCRENSDALIANCDIFENEAAGGGGLCAARLSDCEIVNTTVRDNTAAAFGGGIFIYQADPLVKNSIFWGNNASAGHEFALPSCPASATLTYSDVQGGEAEMLINGGCAVSSGPGVIDADPLFEPGGSLGAGSPCIDAGDDTALPLDVADVDGDADVLETLPLDLAGAARIQGAAVAMGAYETPGTPNCGGNLGDANCDSTVDFFDIDPFLMALFDLSTYTSTFCGGSICTVDTDCSTFVDFFDIDPFLNCLFSGCANCP